MAPFTATKLSPSFFSAKPRHIAIQARQPNIPPPSRLNRYVVDVKRTRDPAVLETCDIVVDVGAVYDESKNLFDHHQRGFTEVFGHGFETKLSSAGLVFKFVRKVVPSSEYQCWSQALWQRGHREQDAASVDDPKVTTLWLKIYQQFIEAIDGIDNGISQYPSASSQNIQAGRTWAVASAALNPVWNQPSSPEIYDAQFAKASQLTGEEFLGKMHYYANAWLPARELLNAFIVSSKEIDPSGKILVFEQYLPWKEHLFEYEEEAKTPESEKAIYAVYPDDGGSWRVQAVPVSSESSTAARLCRTPGEASRRHVVRSNRHEGCVFVHASGFIGEGALRLAKTALEL
ncbi:metal-dependent protein hydrolase [Mycena olivaceomarginata]|nr:metal-dependent protein hydrolase [Mycena olivaceomarginata]